MAEANTTKTQPPGPHQHAWNLQCDACKKVMTTKMSSSPFLSSETRFSPKKSTLKQQGEGGGINDIAFRKPPHQLMASSYTSSVSSARNQSDSSKDNPATAFLASPCNGAQQLVIEDIYV
ncbi:hypothetical protein OsI_01864 [Oryza sativa Indica Group]|uniref:Uncharacterized protein n=3 Tax=Oryza TaxID=4527 RepID=B8A7W3_ORYSI|nr:hypothetical protein OsI_01864 [Oryza sativa Indica Group]